MFKWYREASPKERKAFWGCFGGWSLDAMDAQLFSLVIPSLLTLWHITKADAGVLTSVTLVASAVGGWIAGWASDRYGRVRILQWTVLWFSTTTFLIGLTDSFGQLMAARVLQGIGFGGEWAAGAALMAESIRAENRGKALGTVQSGWAVGWGVAVLLYTALFSILPEAQAWRWLFFVGVVPALLIIFIRRGIDEPEVSVRTRAAASKGRAEAASLLAIFRPQLLRVTLLGALMGVGAHGGYYALTSFLPTFLKTERQLSVLNTGGYLAVIIVGSFIGYVTSGVLADRIGRRRNFLLFSVCCLISLSCYLFLPISNTTMLVLGFPLGFFASGIPAGMGAFFAELFPTSVRGQGQGFCYNAGRILSSAFPVLVGVMSERLKLGVAIGAFAAIAYGIVVLAVLLLPETKGTVFAPDAPPRTAVAGEAVA